MRASNLTRSLVLSLVITSAITVLIRFPIWQVYAGNTITVNSTLDVANSSDGFCTLREAISAANNNAASGATPGECVAGSSSGSDTIVMSATTGTINLASALPDISSDMVINGPGADLLTVQRSTAGGTPEFRIFSINSATTVTISGLTISNGDVHTLLDARGGGVKNEGTLTLSNCKVLGNLAAVGGGIANLGTSLTLTNCNVGGTSVGQPNTATNQAGGIYQGTGTLTINGGAISGNSGAGLRVQDAPTFLNGVTIANNNNVGNIGGGISVLSGGITTTILNVVNSLITGNTASSGAGLANQGATLTLINTTISGNSSIGAGGGMTSVQGMPTLINVTVTNNRCNTGNAGLTGGGFFVPSGFTEGTFKNTIIAGNFRGASPSTTSDDITGSIDPAGSSNLIGNGSGMTGVSDGSNGNQVGSALPINALLASLANNGGPTMTHALLPGSPAINAGSNANLPADTFDLDGDSNAAEPLPVDQRGTGFNRMVNTTVDIGAFESRGFTIAATGGTPQSTTIANTFAIPFSATVSSSFGEPVANGIITFAAPVGGPTGTFSGSVSTMTAATNSSGVATATTFLANGTAGSYIVTAGGNGISSTAQFNLTNLKATTTLLLGSSTNPSMSVRTLYFLPLCSAVAQAQPGQCNLWTAQPLWVPR
jgi:CSLREA domain-containing protein